MKSGLRILIGAPEVPFLIPPKWPKYPVFAILRVSKMALWMPESKFRDHFSIQTSPQNPQKATSGTKIGPRKVIFGNFFNSAYFYVVFPLARVVFFKLPGVNRLWVYNAEFFLAHIYSYVKLNFKASLFSFIF